TSIRPTSPHPPRSPLFPYTTLFRSHFTLGDAQVRRDRLERVGGEVPFGALDRLERGQEPRPLAGKRRQKGIERHCGDRTTRAQRAEEHTSELQSRVDLVCRLLLEKK